jgi:hypothetical protein
MNTTEIGIHMCGQTLTITSCHFHRLGQFNYCVEISDEDVRSAIPTANGAGGLLDRMDFAISVCVCYQTIYFSTGIESSLA